MSEPTTEELARALEGLAISARVRRERVDHLGFKHGQLTGAELEELLVLGELAASRLRALERENAALRERERALVEALGDLVGDAVGAALAQPQGEDDER